MGGAPSEGVGKQVAKAKRQQKEQSQRALLGVILLLAGILKGRPAFLSF